MEEETFQSANINANWLDYIFKHLQTIDEIERLAREGCSNLFDYFQIPQQRREILIGDIQYKNLRFFITELLLLLTDLSPILNTTSLDETRKRLKVLDDIKEERDLFVDESYSASRKSVMSSNVTPLFNEALEFLSETKHNIINDIGHVLYLKETTTTKKPWER